MSEDALIEKFRPRLMPVKFSVGNFTLNDELHIVLSEVWMN